jgi:acetyl-CoA synthetase
LTQAAATYYNIFDVKPDSDVCWTAADIGWITGHSYIVYGPLINGVTSVMYEGLPDSGRPRPLVADH